MYKLFLFLFIPAVILSQNSIPVDSSFAAFSEYKKQVKTYPFIKIAVTEIAPGVIAEKNIPYINYNGRELLLDLFLPPSANGSKVPVVMLIHGGGWRSGSKEMDHPMAAELAANGFAAAAVEYRLSGEARYPAGVKDLKAAILWLKKNGGKYNLDTSKIAVMGSSAGGTLAALLGVTGNSDKFSAAGGSTEVQAIVDVDGILDFTDLAESGKDTNNAKPSAGKLWFGYSYNEKPELWKEASPLLYAGKETPPVLFINSSLARFHAGRDEFIEKIEPFNIYYEVHTINNTPHPFWLFHPWFNETIDHIVKFLQKVFNGK